MPETAENFENTGRTGETGNSVEECLFQRIPFRYVLVAGIILAASILSLIFCTFFGSSLSRSASQTALFSGKVFTESELIQIEMAFAEAQLTDYTISGGVVSVPQKKKNSFLQALKKTEIFVDECENAHSTPGLWLSDAERQQESLREKQTVLAAQIRTFHGIENARVLLDVCETKNGFTRQKHATASITIRSQNHYEVSAGDIQAILHLVTSAVCGLAASDVAVVDTRTNRSWRFPPAPRTASAEGKRTGVSNRSDSENPARIIFQPTPGTDSAAGSHSGMMDAAVRGMLSEDSESLADENSLPYSSDALIDLTQPEGDLVFAPSGIQIGGNAEEPVSHTELHELNSAMQHTEKPSAVSGQRPREVTVLFVLAACSVILVCSFVIYMTRRNLIPAHDSIRENSAEKLTKYERNETSSTFSDSERKSEIRTDFNPAVKLAEQNACVLEAVSQKIPESVTDSAVTPEIPEIPVNSEIPEMSECSGSVETGELPETSVSMETTEYTETAVISEISETSETPEVPEIPELRELQGAEPRHLALALLEERPQTAAMILSQLTGAFVSEVLAEIPKNLRLAIESRMMACETPDEEILKDAACAIQEHLEALESAELQSESRTESGTEISAVSEAENPAQKPMRPRILRPLSEVLPQRVTCVNADFSKIAAKPESFPRAEVTSEKRAEISSESPSETRTGGTSEGVSDGKIDIPSETHTGEPAEIFCPELSFEDLNAFSDTDLRLAFTSCEPRDGVLALLGAEPGFVERLLTLLPKAEAAQVRYQLKHPGRVRLMDAENARRKITLFVQKNVNRGKIQLPETLTAAANR